MHQHWPNSVWFTYIGAVPSLPLSFVILQMTELSINTPALLFPAISLMMLAYTNRFFAIANRVRSLHDEYEKARNPKLVLSQIKNLRRRLNMIRYMQALAVMSFLLCMICMYLIYRGIQEGAQFLFAGSMLCLILSLFFSLVEIFVSTRAVELELSDMEGLEKESLLNVFKKTD
jgi:amino acid transporter